MSARLRPRIALIFVGALLVATTGPVDASGEPPPSVAVRNPGPSCAIEATPQGVVPAVPPTPVCFDTYAEALNFINSPKPATGTGSHYLAIDWDDGWYRGANRLWYNNLYDCYTASFESASYGTFNDRVGSAEIIAESGCVYFYHYEHINWGGWRVHCNCYWIGDAYADKTSSMRLQRNP